MVPKQVKITAQLVAALRVLTSTPTIRQYLQTHQPDALYQAERAIAAANPPDKATGVFLHLKSGTWRARLNGEVLPHTWQTKSAALAGLETECKRAANALTKADK